MPSKERPGKKSVYLELDQELYDVIRVIAEENRRAFKDEVSHALERHAAHRPRVITPPLPDATVIVPAGTTPPTKKRSGRPRKAK